MYNELLLSAWPLWCWTEELYMNYTTWHIRIKRRRISIEKLSTSGSCRNSDIWCSPRRFNLKVAPLWRTQRSVKLKGRLVWFVWIVSHHHGDQESASEMLRDSFTDHDDVQMGWVFHPSQYLQKSQGIEWKTYYIKCLPGWDTDH